MIKTNPEGVRYSMIVQAKEDVSPNSPTRIAFLKEHFDKILDNILPLEAKAALVHFDNMSIQKWLKIQK